jgi:hypothetical protein
MSIVKYLIHNPETSSFTGSIHERIAELVNSYDRNLFLVYVPPEDRTFAPEYPYALIYRPENQAGHIVKWVLEKDVNEGILAWIYLSDQEKDSTDRLAVIEAQEFAAAAVKKAAERELMLAKQDIARSVIGGKNYYTLKLDNGRKVKLQ